MQKPTAWLTKNNSSICHYFTVRDLSSFYGCGDRSSDWGQRVSLLRVSVCVQTLTYTTRHQKVCDSEKKAINSVSVCIQAW